MVREIELGHTQSLFAMNICIAIYNSLAGFKKNDILDNYLIPFKTDYCYTFGHLSFLFSFVLRG